MPCIVPLGHGYSQTTERLSATRFYLFMIILYHDFHTRVPGKMARKDTQKANNNKFPVNILIHFTSQNVAKEFSEICWGDGRLESE